MDTKNLSELSDEELLEEGKKRKRNNTATKFMIGIVIGIAIWSATHKGSFIFIILLMFFVYILSKGSKDYEAVKKEIESRKLN